MFSCKNCEKEFDTPAKLHGHTLTCKEIITKEQDDDDRSERKTEHRELETRSKVTRETRQHYGVRRLKLKVDHKDPNFKYWWFNDNNQRDRDEIQYALNCGWEFVNRADSGKVAGKNEDGSGYRRVLMRQPREWYEEDIRLRDESLKSSERAIRKGAYERKNSAQHEYIPREGISMDVKYKP